MGAHSCWLEAVAAGPYIKRSRRVKSRADESTLLLNQRAEQKTRQKRQSDLFSSSILFFKKKTRLYGRKKEYNMDRLPGSKLEEIPSTLSQLGEARCQQRPAKM